MCQQVRDTKIKKCKRCGSVPELYGEGMAREEYDRSGWEMHFTSHDGYVVECPCCEARTVHYADVDAAVEKWNKIYGGEEWANFGW